MMRMIYNTHCCCCFGFFLPLHRVDRVNTESMYFCSLVRSIVVVCLYVANLLKVLLYIPTYLPTLEQQTGNQAVGLSRYLHIAFLPTTAHSNALEKTLQNTYKIWGLH